MVLVAMSIFTVYNAINDPIFAFLMDRNMRFTRKWGRRFPWIVIGIIPWTFSVYLLYSTPDVDVSLNPWPIFFWLLLSLVVLDTFGTLVNINFNALRPDMFRTEEERRTFSKYYTPIDLFAVILGMLLPAFFIDLIPGDKKAGYKIMGVMIAIISLIFAILSLPGNREDKVMIDRYFSTKIDDKQMGFLKATKEALKLKSFIVNFVFGVFSGIQTSLVVINMLYTTNFVLQASSIAYLVILGTYLTGTFISIPFWIRYLKKINNNKKAYVVAGLSQSITLIPLTFFYGFNDLIIMAFIFGFASGGLNTYTYTIIQPSMVDDFVVKTRKNQKAILFGISAFLGRFVATIYQLIFAVVHDLTGFVAGYDTYSEMAAVVSNMNLVLIGIRLLQGVIPAAFLFVGIMIFWKFFPLTQDVVLKNKAELEKLGF